MAVTSNPTYEAQYNILFGLLDGVSRDYEYRMHPEDANGYPDLSHTWSITVTRTSVTDWGVKKNDPDGTPLSGDESVYVDLEATFNFTNSTGSSRNVAFIEVLAPPNNGTPASPDHRLGFIDIRESGSPISLGDGREYRLEGGTDGTTQLRVGNVGSDLVPPDDTTGYGDDSTGATVGGSWKTMNGWLKFLELELEDAQTFVGSIHGYDEIRFLVLPSGSPTDAETHDGSPNSMAPAEYDMKDIADQDSGHLEGAATPKWTSVSGNEDLLRVELRNTAGANTWHHLHDADLGTTLNGGDNVELTDNRYQI